MERLHLVIAGDTDPVALRRIVEPELRQALLELHFTGQSLLLERLQALGLATGNVPGLFVATEIEAEVVSRHAFEVAAGLAGAVEQRWNDLEALFRTLDFSRSQSLAEAGFLFVGDFVLDVGLLDALATDGTLMPPAPMRSIGELQPSRYYLWLVEGSPHLLGQYGQRQIGLPWPGWTMTTYGRYFVDGRPNAARQTLIDRVMGEAASADGPAELAAQSALPLISPTDMNRWRGGIAELLRALVDAYKREEQAVRSLHAGLVGEADVERTFGEFFCWYDHLVYAHVIDRLVERGRFSTPAEGFTAAIVHPWSMPDAFSSR